MFANNYRNFSILLKDIKYSWPIRDNVYNNSNIDEVENGNTVIRKLKSAACDLLIPDINMPNMESFSLTSYLLNEFSSLKILLFTINQELLFAKRFLQSGVHGYMTKDSKEPDIRSALQKILCGEVYISDWLADALLVSIFFHSKLLMVN